MTSISLFVRVLFAFFVTFGLWVGAAQLGKWLHPESDLMILYALVGILLGIKISLRTLFR